MPGIRITAIQPSPYDDVTRAPLFDGGYNAVLVRYGDFLKQLAKDQGLSVADLNTGVVAALQKANGTDATAAGKLIPDRVHPGAAVHLLMAEGLLKSWNAPALVSDVELDASRKEPLRQRNSHVSSISAQGKGLAWTQLDDALPMPVDLRDAATALAVRSSDFTEALNQEPLKIRGLSTGGYTLKIDGEPIGSFTASQLSEGLNMAVLQTPITRQAARVHALTLRHNNLHSTRWRQVQVPLEKDATPHLLKALDALDDLESDVIREQRAAAQPIPHRFELIPE
jgi:hypothetical protein